MILPLLHLIEVKVINNREYSDGCIHKSADLNAQAKDLNGHVDDVGDYKHPLLFVCVERGGGVIYFHVILGENVAREIHGEGCDNGPEVEDREA